MERFEVSSERVSAAADRTIQRVPVAPVAATASTTWDSEATVAPSTASHGGLVAVGAAAGSAAGVGVGALLGATGPLLTFAALIGLDVGVLLGAGTGALLSRRQRRAAQRALTEAATGTA